MTLAESREGQVLVVKNLAAGFGAKRRLFNLGILPGERLTVLKSAAFGGPVLVEVRGTEVALGRGVARKIEVEDVRGGSDL